MILQITLNCILFCTGAFGILLFFYIFYKFFVISLLRSLSLPLKFNKRSFVLLVNAFSAVSPSGGGDSESSIIAVMVAVVLVLLYFFIPVKKEAPSDIPIESGTSGASPRPPFQDSYCESFLPPQHGFEESFLFIFCLVIFLKCLILILKRYGFIDPTDKKIVLSEQEELNRFFINMTLYNIFYILIALIKQSS